MPRYKVQHNYKSGTFGPWQEGDEVTLDSAEAAEHVNRDSPGTLEEIDPDKAAAEKRERFQRDQDEREQARSEKAAAAKAESAKTTPGPQHGSKPGR